MTSFEAALLGVVQGLAEFLPISSSGHLVIVQRWLGIIEPALTFNVAVHFGSLLAVVVALRAEWIFMAQSLAGKAGARNAEGRRLFFLLVIGSLPVAIVGFIARDFIESTFASAWVPAIMLFVTGGLLWFADNTTGNMGRPLERIRFQDALVMGIGQAIALLPGLSRSGSTMSFGLFTGLDRSAAARFSFLLAVPAVFGATLLESVKLFGEGVTGTIAVTPTLIGVIASAITSYAAIRFFLAFVRRGRLRWFAWYVWLIGAIVIGMLLTGGM